MFNKTMELLARSEQLFQNNEDVLQCLEFRRNNKINFIGLVIAVTRNSIDNKWELEFTLSQIEQLVTQYEEDATQSYRLTVI